MNTIQKIAKNTGFLLVGRITTKIINLFVIIYMVRYLGDAGYGKYAFAFAFISFFNIISELGTHNIVVREIARSPEIANKLIGNAVLISIVSSITALSLSVLTIHFLDYPVETKYLVQLASLELLLGALSPFGAIYEANLEMKYSVIFGVLNRLFLFVSTFVIIYYDLGLILLVLATVASDALYSVLAMIYSRKYIRPKFYLDIDLCKSLLKESIPLALTSVFIIIYFRIDVVMLSMMKGDSEVGIYSAAYRLTEAFTFIPNIYMVSMFPLMSRYFKNSKENLTLAYIKSFKYLLSISLPLAAIVTFFADEIIYILYGNQVHEAVAVLKILIWATAIMFINYSLVQLLVSINRQKVTTISTAICAFINIGLNYLLIPQLSYQGAALATVATELINALIMIYYLPNFISLAKLIYDIRAPVMASILMFLLMFAINSYNELFAIPIIISYPILIYLLGGIDKEDKKLFNKLIGKQMDNNIHASSVE
ncbi:Membrane protein involved in the export of O-antigen, teichoic acid lipoteichoic acids [Methanosarcina siciliae T4/M]|uniref:Membrane protein involved in the export of O-antigen, teichoic acid lipoteichoic acids n=1 Tax=Methanosarcina siciliae T4/M TaxID=1434120 RepID=A0A0E3L967_9EURY|nr:flippase [Methanosarcina siciliae]AKB29741.1 Membrane protein involved in the export of O-antigen, teichoic acid lipoteichoic acids [Methanosarcina siciliae T4/M]